MAAKKGAKKKMTKTAFVLSLGRDMPAKDVVAKAKESGFTLSEKHVYNIRSEAKRKGGTVRRRGRPPKASNGATSLTAAVRARAGSGTSAELLLRALGAELGLSRAIAILESERERVRAALRG